jgi:hypothetical protein
MTVVRISTTRGQQLQVIHFLRYSNHFKSPCICYSTNRMKQIPNRYNVIRWAGQAIYLCMQPEGSLPPSQKPVIVIFKQRNSLHFFKTYVFKDPFLAALPKSRKASVSFIMSDRLLACTYQHGSHWTDWREIWYCGLSWKSVENFQILLKSGVNTGHYMKT